MKIRFKSILICLAIIGVALFVWYLRDGFGGLTSPFFYPNSSRYQSGSASVSGEIKKIEINWISGKVSILPGDSQETVFTEQSSQELNDGNSLRYWLDGTTLRIRAFKSGPNLNAPSKDLNLMLPRGTEYDSLSVEVVSADTEISGITASDLIYSGTSGSLNAAGQFDKVSADTVSGFIAISVEDPRELRISSVSGDADLDLVSAPKVIKFSTVSGETKVRLPSSAEFTLKFSTVSGDFRSEFNMVSNGSTHICGDGACDYSIDSVSGDLSVLIR